MALAAGKFEGPKAAQGRLARLFARLRRRISGVLQKIGGFPRHGGTKRRSSPAVAAADPLI